MTTKRCLGCMEPLEGGKQACQRCNWEDERGPASGLYLEPGTVLQEQYLLGRVLGHGGFGVTYLAWDLVLERKLAVKEYLPSGEASRATGQVEITVFYPEVFQFGLRQFLKEGQVLAKFQGHAGVVDVLNFFQANSTAYLVMELLEGVSLEEHLLHKGGSLGWREAIEILQPALAALNEVHGEGFLHRDVSPDNVIVLRRGGVKLIDLGAARYALSQRSRNLSVLLKEGYAPPEQYYSTGRQGPWTDVYAAGATLYRAICGQVPPPSLDRSNEDTLQLPSQAGISLPAQVEQALVRSLALQAPARFQSVEDFRAALTAAAPPPPPGASTAASSRARPSLLGQGRRLVGRAWDIASPRLEQAARRAAPLLSRAASGCWQAAARLGKGAQALLLRLLPWVHGGWQRWRKLSATVRWISASLLAGILLISLSFLFGPSALPYQQQTSDHSSQQTSEDQDSPFEGGPDHDQGETSTTTPVPALVSLEPASVPPGREVRVIVRGRGFVPGCLVEWNQQRTLPTEFIDSSQVRATIPAATLSAPGQAKLTVWNPKGDGLGYRSSPIDLRIADPAADVVDSLLQEARRALQSGDAGASRESARQAAARDPMRPEPQDLLGYLELYGFNNSAQAAVHYREALRLQGRATFRLRHDHSALTFAKSCTGTLWITAGQIEFRSPSGDGFSAGPAQIRDVGWSKGFLGLVRQSEIFGIKTASRNYNFKGTSRSPRQEGQLIMNLLPGGSSRTRR